MHPVVLGIITTFEFTVIMCLSAWGTCGSGEERSPQRMVRSSVPLVLYEALNPTLHGSCCESTSKLCWSPSL